MMTKRLLVPERRRQIPGQFSWVDQQLVRGHHLRACDPSAWALYLFLVTVADADGLSYYSDASVQRWLRLEAPGLHRARQQLRQAGLLAFDAPLYQLLALPNGPAVVASRRANDVVSAGQVLRQLLGGTQP
jgi:hypothetical protein